jgi:hypothetical protein
VRLVPTPFSSALFSVCILSLFAVTDQLPVFGIMCSIEDMRRLKWIDGLLVCVNSLALPNAKPNSEESTVVKKVFARVLGSPDVSEGHIIGHRHLFNDVLSVHQYSRVRIQPMASEDLAKSVSRIYLRPRKRDSSNTSGALSNGKADPALTELASSLSALVSSEYASLGARAIPMMNGSVVSACGGEYSLYFNLEFEEESPAPRQQPERSQEDMSFTGIANALPALPGMPDMGAIDTIRDVYNRAMDARARAAVPKAVRPLADQMSSKDLYYMDPKAIADIASSVRASTKGSSVRFRIGDVVEIDSESPVAGSPTFVPEVRLEEIGGLDKEVRLAVQHITSILGFNRLRESLSPASAMFARGALFIHGQHGSGKSMFANAIATHFASSTFKSRAYQYSS